MHLCEGLYVTCLLLGCRDKLTNQAGLINVLGALYASVLFFAIINALVVQPVIASERAVSYRERAAGMYSFAPWVLALVRQRSFSNQGLVLQQLVTHHVCMQPEGSVSSMDAT